MGEEGSSETFEAHAPAGYARLRVPALPTSLNLLEAGDASSDDVESWGGAAAIGRPLQQEELVPSLWRVNHSASLHARPPAEEELAPVARSECASGAGATALVAKPSADLLPSPSRDASSRELPRQADSAAAVPPLLPLVYRQHDIPSQGRAAAAVPCQVERLGARSSSGACSNGSGSYTPVAEQSASGGSVSGAAAPTAAGAEAGRAAPPDAGALSVSSPLYC